MFLDNLEKMICGQNYSVNLIKDNINRIIDSLEKGFATIRFAELVEDPTSRDSVNAAVTALNGMLKDDDVVDLSGSYVWPTVNFTTGTKNNIKYKNGTFKRLDNIGVEYLFWLNGEDSSVSYCNFDGGSASIPTWGQQCIYIPEAVNVKVHANTFKNIGDAAIRFARKASQIDELTKNVIISNNVFQNVGQITSNDTGALRVNINGNIFDHTPVKITQTQLLSGEGQTHIVNNIFKQTAKDRKLVEVQGGENVKISQNSFIGEGLDICIGLYPNTSFKAPLTDKIPLKNIIIENNEFYMKDVKTILYLEAKQKEDLSPELNEESFISVSGNKVWSAPADASPVRTRFLVTYIRDDVDATPTSFAKRFSVTNNEIYGEVVIFVRLFEHGMNPGDTIYIKDNICSKAIDSFMTLHLNGLNGDSGDIYVSGNYCETPVIFDNSTYPSQKRVRSLTLSNNHFKIVNDSVISDPVTGLELNFADNVKSYKIKDNIFEVESEDITGELISVIPPASVVDSVGTQLWVIDNTLIKPYDNASLAEMSSLDIKATSTDGTIEKLYCSNNKYGGSLTAPVSNETSIAIGDINLTSF